MINIKNEFRSYRGNKLYNETSKKLDWRLHNLIESFTLNDIAVSVWYQMREKIETRLRRKYLVK